MRLNISSSSLSERDCFWDFASNLKYLFSLLNTYDEKVEKSLEKLCEEFNLNLYNKEKIKNYSVGMRQKVSIIQAIMEDHAKKKDKIIIIASHDLMDKLAYNRQLIIRDFKIYEKNN